jgi:hypothetical protein
MTTLTFVSQLITALAWPFTVLVCAVLFRPLIIGLVPLVRKLKYSDVEIQFGKELADIKATSGASVQSATPEASQRPIWEELIRLATVNPRVATLKAWEQVELALARVARGTKVEVADAAWHMPMVLGALLLRDGKISPEQYELLTRLRELVNEATHAPINSVSSTDAVDFIGLALRASASLDAAAS